MQIAVIVNQKRCDASVISDAMLKNLAAQYKFNYDFFLSESDDLQVLCTSLSTKSYNAFLIAGGDGTVRSAVQCLIGQEKPLIVLPMGTFNFFAKMLDYPSNLEATIKVILNNKTKLVDVCAINNVVFLNHASIGFYAHIIKEREKYKKILGKSRVLKVIFAALNFLHVLPIYKLSLQAKGELVEYDTCLLFVGNNYHSMSLLDFGSRQTLSAGELAVYVLQCQTRWQLIKIFLSIFFNRFDQSRFVNTFTTSKLTVYSRSKFINVVLDGELFKLEAPLQYAIYNKQLNVLVP